MRLEELVRAIPDHPKKGIVFRDITTLLEHPAGFGEAIEGLVEPLADQEIDRIAGIEARGFILGGAVAHRLSLGFVTIRKKGKLPWKTLSERYDLEYGSDEMEIHVDSIQKGDRVLVVDDLIATGGTATAAIELIRRAGGEIAGASFVIDLPDLGGSRKLESMGVEVRSLIEFSGE